ncbi:hypothetical protein RD792_014995 [Penstemon davidsonii]|uniref:glycerophosphodiester phosphodiesterase n=1 Tax=Penstemon davidsonii TaxID=160366 RepID=A0ABR0CSM2_9LAMI|nr:hypothetical protein RD792_014995 [Penstemon davidsonii]
MIGRILLFITLLHTIEAKGKGGIPHPHPHPPQTKWMTLLGDQPEVVAKGGYSGIFPDSSMSAYSFAADMSIPGTIMYCNLHFTKDNDGFCVSQINLQNTTNIQNLDPKGEKTYTINGQEFHGWFGLDYPASTIFDNVSLIQDIFTRTDTFDGEPMVSPLGLVGGDDNKIPMRVWLNIEYDLFYKEHNISPEDYLFGAFKLLPEFVSSPEIDFLKAIGPKLGQAKTKLIFKFNEKDILEPTTKEKYGSLVNKLAMIKTFASGILVPKEYIWPIDAARILQPATSLVQDAHKIGLAVYASDFANDNFISYNYSFDPTKEYLQFVDNSQFSVDGVLTAFPSTASEAIGCLSQNKNATRVLKTLIISHNGASGDFPGASDLAYQKAIDDGADIIDCSVQLSKDGIAFCSDTADLIKTTNAATLYMDRSRNVAEVQATDGIFSFDLTWAEIQALKPQIESAYDKALARNPANKNVGKIVALSEFLELAKAKAVPGILVFIQNAAYLASKNGLDIVGTVTTALSNATLDKQSTQKVLIQSDDSSVLLKFKDIPSYQRVLYLNSVISAAPSQVALEVKKYADAVYVHRSAIVIESADFAFNFTNTIPTLRAANISVYVGVLKNEFMNLMFDYLSDPYVELETLNSQGVDGFVTDFPATASSFVRSSCTTNGSLYSIKPVKPGLLAAQPPVAEPPLLSTADVVDPPLPAITKAADAALNVTAAPAPASASATKSSGTSISASLFIATMAGLLSYLVLE